MRVRVEWKPEDLWVGAYWRRTQERVWWSRRYDLWICLLPCLPLHVTWYRPGKER
jgi:hypothetical protein